MSDLGAGHSGHLEREVPWTQRRKRVSFGGRSDRASRASSVGSYGSEHSFTSFPATPQPSPQSSPSKALGRSKQRRQPTMTRIVSGQGLDLMGLENLGRGPLEPSQPHKVGQAQVKGATPGGGGSNPSPSFNQPMPFSVDSAPDEDSFCYNGHLAVDVLPYDTTDALLQEVKLVVTDAMLLHFGACLGESSAQLALGLRSKASDERESLYGVPDNPEAYARGWEKVVEEHKNGLHYFVHRRSLRKGLYMYKSRAVYEMASTSEMMAFTFADHQVRRGWDDSSTALRPLPPPSWKKPQGPARTSAGGTLLLQPFGRSSDNEEEETRLLTAASYCQSSFMYARTRFPPPMAQREYVYARRVWYKADDGGCYCISKSCPVGPLTSPPVPSAGCRTVRVTDFSSGVVIRAVPGIYHRQGAVEVVTNYFEDSCAASGIINMAVRKALWPMIQKSEAGFRRYQAALKDPGMNSNLPGLTRRLPPFDSPPPPPPSRLPSRLDDESSLNGESDEEFTDARCILSPRSDGEKDAPTTILSSQLPSIVEIDRNAGMFSEYHPALSYPRLHLTPILYAIYLIIMRLASLPLQLMIGFMRLLPKALKSSQARALMIKSQTKGEGGIGRVVEGKGSSKVTFSAGGSVPPTSRPPLLRSISRSENRKQGLLRRLASFAVVASRAVTVPLLHQAMVASDESRNRSGLHQRAFNTTQENIRGAKSKFPRTRAFVKAVLGQQLSDLREDFFYY